MAKSFKQKLPWLLSKIFFFPDSPWGRPHSRTAVFGSSGPPGDHAPCARARNNNRAASRRSCLWPAWSAGGGWSLSSALPHSPHRRSLWCWSAFASPGPLEESPSWRSPVTPSTGGHEPHIFIGGTEGGAESLSLSRSLIGLIELFFNHGKHTVYESMTWH